MTLKRSTDVRPRKGWREDPTRNRRQLTHAVSPGSSIALCGVRVGVTGEGWPDSDSSVTPLTRCPVCTQAISLIHTGEHYF